MAIRKSIAILAVLTAIFTVACETDEDPGVNGDIGVTTIAPGGDTLPPDTTMAP